MVVVSKFLGCIYPADQMQGICIQRKFTAYLSPSATSTEKDVEKEENQKQSQNSHSPTPPHPPEYEETKGLRI